MMNNFKHKQEVLYRAKNDDWTYGIISHVSDDTCVLIGGIYIHLNNNNYEIIPYENHEHLVGTRKNILNEPIFLNEDEYIVVNNDFEMLKQGIGFITTFKQAYEDDICTGNGYSFGQYDHWNYAIRLCEYDINNPENNFKYIFQSRNSILSKIIN